MTEKFRTEEQPSHRGFAGDLQAAVERMSAMWERGVHSDYSKITQVWHRIMHSEVFDLACAIVKSETPISHILWTHWMLDAEIYEAEDAVIIRHRSEFFTSQITKHFGTILHRHYGKPIKYQTSRAIAARMDGKRAA